MGLYAKMAQIMGAVQQIEKDQQMNAGQLNYKYVSDAAVYHKMRGLLIEHGLALFASMTDVQQQRYVVGTDKFGNERDKFHTTARFEFTLVDSETGDAHTSVWYAESEDSADKGVNKCATAALKYWLLKTFIIPTGDDPDASDGAGEPTEPPRHIPQRDTSRKMATGPGTPGAPKAKSELDEHFGPRNGRDSIADKPEPVQAVWADDDKSITDLCAWARDVLWLEDGAEPLTWPHVYARIAKALRLQAKPKNRKELQEAIRNEFGGDKAAAASLLKAYEPGAEQAEAAS